MTVNRQNPDTAGSTPMGFEAVTDPGLVKIFDTTLRDGEQSPGIALDTEEKKSIALQLGKLGVDIIEAGFPINSAAEAETVRAIAQTMEGVTIAALARAMPGDIIAAAKAIKDAATPRIHTFISTSDIHIVHQMGSDRETILGQARAGVAHAKSFVDDVEFSPMDATRSDWEYTAEVVEAAIEEGAKTINIPDTVGFTTPEEYREFIEFLRANVRGAEKVIWSVHCHNDLGLAVANSYAGILGGARQFQGTINGIGERAGNASIDEIVMLIHTRGTEEGLKTNIVNEELGPTGRLVSRVTGYPIPPNKPIIGRNAFAHESGIHQDGVLKERTTYEVMDPKSVGWDANSIFIGKHTGRAGAIAFLEQLPGYDKNSAAFTYKLFKGFLDKKGNVSAEQLTEIHDEAKRRNRSKFNMEDYSVSTSEETKTARVSLVDKAGGKYNGSSKNDEHQTEIDGAVAAIIGAISEATDVSYEVEDCVHSSVGEGKSAIDKATVTILINGKTVKGQGLSTDTIKAAGLAYIDAITKAESKN